MTRRTGGRKTKLIEAAVREKLGVQNPRVWYEPINGPCMEMQGYAGGWYYLDADDIEDVADDFGEPLGYTVDQALEMIEITARMRDRKDSYVGTDPQAR